MAKNRKAQRANPKRQRRALHLEFQEYVVLITGWNWSYSLSLDTSRPIGFKLLYGFVIIRLDRRDLVWIGVTTNPTAEWVARQITEAFPLDGGPRYMIRDRTQICGTAVTRRLRAMGIRDKPIAPASPWQNSFAERLIGS